MLRWHKRAPNTAGTYSDSTAGTASNNKTVTVAIVLLHFDGSRTRVLVCGECHSLVTAMVMIAVTGIVNPSRQQLDAGTPSLE